MSANGARLVLCLLIAMLLLDFAAYVAMMWALFTRGY